MSGPDGCPAECRDRDRSENGSLRLRHDAQVPLAFRGRKGDLAKELLDIEPVGIGLVSHLEYRAPLLDAIAVDVAAEELAAVKAPGDHDRHVRAGECRLPEHRILSPQ